MPLPALPPHSPAAEIAPVYQTNPWGIDYQNQNASDSESSSDSTSVLDQSGTQNNIQNNFSDLNYIQYRNGVRVPAEWSIFGTTSFTDSGNDIVSTIGVQWTPQGKAKKLAQRTVSLDNTAREASICAGLLKDGIQIDYELKPELSFCQGYTAMLPPPPPILAPPAPSPEIEFYKQKLREQEMLLRQMQERLNQLMTPVRTNNHSG